MPKLALTQNVIAKLAAPSKGAIYFYDAKTASLAVAVTETGAKTFYLCRRINGKPERIRLGRVGDLTLEDARREAAKIQGNIAREKNPAEERRKAKNALTLRELFDRFIASDGRTRANEQHARTAKTIDNYTRWFDGNLKVWERRQIATITGADVQALRDAINATGKRVTANRVVTLLRAMFNFAIAGGLVEKNPTSGIRRNREESIVRRLSTEELPRFWKAVEACRNEKLRDLIKLAAFTGARRGSVLAMRWADLDIPNKLWTTQTKTGRKTIPLPDGAVEVLRRRQQTAKGEYVIPGNSETKPFHDPAKQWRALLKQAKITGFRFHDLRHNLASYMAMGGVSLQTIAVQLGHDDPMTSARYAHLMPSAQPAEAAIAAMMAAVPRAAGG